MLKGYFTVLGHSLSALEPIFGCLLLQEQNVFHKQLYQITLLVMTLTFSLTYFSN